MKRISSALAALAVLVPLLAPAAARANTYDVYSCWAGYGTFHNPNASSLAWTRDQTAGGGHFVARDDCGVNPVDGAITVRSFGSAPALNGQYAQLRFTAPIGLTIDQVQFWRNAWAYGSGTGSTSQRGDVRVLASGAAVTGGTDADGTFDVASGTRGTSDTTSHGLIPANSYWLGIGPSASSSIEYRVGCDWSAGCPTSSPSGPNSSAVGVNIYGSKVTIQDASVPTIAVSDGGLFSQTGASGVQPVIVTTSNDTSGIKRLAVFADLSSTPVGELDYEQDVNWCVWTAPAPCQNVADAEIPVDTRQLSNGDHSFVVKAFDAAGNEESSATHYATIRNASADPTPTPQPTPDPTPTPAPSDQTTPDAGLPNGTSDSSGGVGVVASPKLSVVFGANNRSRLSARYGRMVVVHGTLVDGAGARIANAQIDYSALSTTPRARVQNLGAVRTDNDGTFTLTVATKLGSRKLEFAYRPQLGGTIATAADAQLDVKAPVSLRIRPHFVHNGHRITFGGRLSAGPVPRKGKLVNLQVVVDGHWHTFATVRTNKSGRFKYRYRFTRTYGHVTYRFRALSRYEAAYPFTAGSSSTVAVHVTSCPVGCE